MPLRIMLGFALSLVLADPAAAQQVAPLFAEDAPIRIAIQGPLGAISQNRNARNSRPGTLTFGAEQLPIMLTARGITRRSKETCDFPPLRLEFPAAPPAGSVFAGQRRLKLVTHCKSGARHQQYVLMEHAAYRIFNQLSPLSFRTRLAIIDYREPNGRPMTSRVGFFIEEVEDLGRRNGMSRAATGDSISVTRLEPTETARAALFSYMIGNLDWSMRAGPAGETCCHNFRLLAKPGAAKLVPVPYDFDFSGLVNAPYATPPSEIDVSSVRERRYRGYCWHNAQTIAAAADFRAKRPAIEAMLGSIPGLEPRTAQRANAYLAPFWLQIASDGAVRDRILKNCIN